MYNNSTGVPLSLAVWLAHDSYDHNADPTHISATGLIKPLKQIILGTRIPTDATPADISSLVQSGMGTAIHDSIESAWVNNYTSSMKALGYPQGVIDRIAINPTSREVKENPDNIPVYMELRSSKTVEGMTISGKFDFVADGRVEDFKSTSTFTYVNKSNDAKYQLQGSIYRWLNQDIITKDHMAIQFIFTDWKAMQALANPKYPKTRTLEYKIPLLSIPKTELFIRDKIIKIKTLMNEPQDRLPACTDEDLWRRAPVFKYYKDPNKTTRSTKNFDNSSDAQARLSTEGKGMVIEVKGEVVACRYCNAASICQQKDAYLADGTLKL